MGRIAAPISLPTVILDFNPGGPTVTVEFLDRLNKDHPNVQYVKLEEPFSPGQMKAIQEPVGKRTEAFGHWGRYHMREAAAGVQAQPLAIATRRMHLNLPT